jgi:hypothetical protein
MKRIFAGNFMSIEILISGNGARLFDVKTVFIFYNFKQMRDAWEYAIWMIPIWTIGIFP